MAGSHRIPPLSTVTFIFICVVVYVLQITINLAPQKFTLNPYHVFKGEWYRIISSSFMHGNLTHILMNMISYLTLGSSLERKLGSLFMFFTILWSVILSSLFHIAIATVLLLWTKGPFHDNSLGFSGALFHLLVLEFIMPNISFLGHLSGIFVGSLQIFWGPLLIPCAEYLDDLDDMVPFSFFNNYIDCVRTSRESINQLYSSYNTSSSSSLIVLRESFGNIRLFLRNVFETLKFIIVGGNDSFHSNVSRIPHVSYDDEELGLTRS